MEAFILAGGRGTRLLPLTLKRPKPLIPFLNKPILDYIIESLVSINASKITILLDYLGDKIIQRYGNGSDFGIEIEYTFGNGPRGTAGAVAYAARNMSEPFLVLSADVLTNIDLKSFWEFHNRKKGMLTIALSQVEDPWHYGIAILNEDKSVLRFVEKPPPEKVFSNLVNAGIYVMTPESLKYIPSDIEYDISKGLLPALLAKGEKIFGYAFSEYWNDVGRPSSYLAATQDALLGRLKIRGLPYSEFEESERILSNMKELRGRLLVTGERCKIAGSAKINGFAVLGDDVEIGKNAEISGCVIWSGSKVDKNAIIRQCVVGEDVQICSGARCDAGSVIGDMSIIGERAHVGQDIKLWVGSRLGAGTAMDGI